MCTDCRRQRELFRGNKRRNFDGFDGNTEYINFTRSNQIEKEKAAFPMEVNEEISMDLKKNLPKLNPRRFKLILVKCF